LSNNLTGSTTITYGYPNYDRVGNRLACSIDGQDAQLYSYDKLYQLIYVDYNDLDKAWYAYDKLGNRTKMTRNTTSTFYDSNALNQYVHVDGVAYTYDKNGNLTYDGQYTYSYDYENKLTQVKQGQSVIATYKYDFAGRRVSKTAGQITTTYLYDGDSVIAEYQGQGTTCVCRYVFGPGIDESISMTSGANTYYYHFDGLGSVVALSNTSGQVVERYNYDAFGQPSAASSLGNRYMFTGREYDSETGNYYYRARYYSPKIGRFLQTDPTGYDDGINWYVYCGNNPINGIDPLGLDWLDNTANYCAGWSDTLSFGMTKVSRRLVNMRLETAYNILNSRYEVAWSPRSNVDTSSTAYKTGEWTGVANGIGIGIAGGIKAAGSKTAGNEFSHWIPQRAGGPRSILNGNYVTPETHFLQDPYRFPTGWQNYGPKWNQIIQQLSRIPNVFKGTALGIGWGVGGKVINDSLGNNTEDTSSKKSGNTPSQ
jgi:RHS repeat-associated protein